MQHIIALTPDHTDCLPRCLEPLTAVVVARFANNGRLLHGNLGFQRFMPTALTHSATPVDMGHFFLRPSFHDLQMVQAPIGQPVYQGILNVTDALGMCRSLIGAVHRQNDELMLVAEYDVAEMERLNAQVIELNLELAEVERTLARTNRALQANEERLKQLSTTDPLTGLANRRQLMYFLSQAWQRSRRFASTFSLIMADIDFFKKINDQYGHPQGDVVLKAVTAQMQAMVRKVDLVARFGGEEFVIVLQEVDLHAAVELAQRLRQAVSELTFDGLPSGVTCSYGVAQMHPDEDIEQLLKHADLALYDAKRNGRNRVSTEQSQ
ncbi:GGDEF domain-containing protein [Rhodoferax sp.]|uniref:GGDEF domain-containing protein n=1 Tax=Rhodoferax sp. TaxID=50421 RepID=UPI0025E3C0EE|nr:GGDEF domain-containing protein [Rhodoferax sp.]MCM2340786.1 GGDEF domain-containing protein [Rhodoferax sp.]